MRLELKRSVIRTYAAADAPSLAKNADNRAIWSNLRDAFPHPYALEDAQWFIGFTLDSDPNTNFAIEVDGEAVGGIGFKLGEDVERVGAEIGYWLGEPHWGRGIVSEAVAAVARYAMQQHDLTRVFALPFAHNAASLRVLEKAGFVAEGRLRHSAKKDGVIVDQILYALIRDDLEGPRD